MSGDSAKLELQLPDGRSVWVHGNPPDIAQIIAFARLARAAARARGEQKPEPGSSGLIEPSAHPEPPHEALDAFC